MLFRKESSERFLRDIVEYGEGAREVVAAASFERFVTDRDLRHLVYYRVQCVPEAIRHVLDVDPAIAERAPEIPWRSIRGVGNVLRHDYGDVEAAIIWRAVTGADLAALLAVARLGCGGPAYRDHNHTAEVPSAVNGQYT